MAENPTAPQPNSESHQRPMRLDLVSPHLMTRFLRVENEGLDPTVIREDTGAAGLFQITEAAKKNIAANLKIKPEQLNVLSPNQAAKGAAVHLGILSGVLASTESYHFDQADRQAQLEAQYLIYNEGEQNFEAKLKGKPITPANLKRAFPAHYKSGGSIERFWATDNDKRFLMEATTRFPQIYSSLDETLTLSSGESMRQVNMLIDRGDPSMRPTTNEALLQSPTWVNPNPQERDNIILESDRNWQQLEKAHEFHQRLGVIDRQGLEEPIIGEDLIADAILGVGSLGVVTGIKKAIGTIFTGKKLSKRAKISAEEIGLELEGTATDAFTARMREFARQQLTEGTSHDEVTEKALKGLRDGTLTIEKFFERKAGEALNEVQTRGLDILVNQAGRDMQAIVKALDNGSIDLESAKELIMRQVETATRLAAVERGSAQTTGLTLETIRSTQEQISKMLISIGESRIPGATPEDLINKVRLMPDIDRKNAFWSKLSKGGSHALKIVNEIYLSGLLSNPKTIVKNAIGSQFMLLERGIEKTFEALHPSSPVTLTEAGRFIKAYFGGLAQSMLLLPGVKSVFPEAAIRSGAIWSSIKAERMSKFGMSQTVLDAKGLGVDGVPIIRNVANMFSSALNLTRGSINFTDNYARFIAYNMEIEAQVGRTVSQLRKQGVPKNQILKQVQEIRDNPAGVFRVDPRTGNFVPIRQLATEFGSEVTFQKQLRGMLGDIARDPKFRLLSPFMNTAVRMSQAAFERTPIPVALASTIGRFSPKLKAALVGDNPEARAIARSKMIAGLAYMGLAMNLADEGMITGNGPRSIALRQAGRQQEPPNSVIIHNDDGTKTAMPLADFPVVGPLMTLVADLSKLSTIADTKAYSDVSIMAAGIFAEAMGAASIFEDFNAFASALATGNFQGYLNGKLTSYMPLSALGRGLVNTEQGIKLQGDIKGLQAIVDGLKKQIPGWDADGLSPYRDFWGNVQEIPPGFTAQLFNPFATTTTKHNEKQVRIMEEFQRQGMQPEAPDFIFMNGVYLGHEAAMARRWAFGHRKVGGKTLEERLFDIIDSPQYKNPALSDLQQGTGFDRPIKSHRADMLQQAISKHRKAADAWLIKRKAFGGGGFREMLDRAKIRFKQSRGRDLTAEESQRIQQLEESTSLIDLGEYMKDLFDPDLPEVEVG